MTAMDPTTPAFAVHAPEVTPLSCAQLFPVLKHDVLTCALAQGTRMDSPSREFHAAARACDGIPAS